MQAINLATANKIIEGTIAAARAGEHAPLGIAVLDAGGHIITYSREDGATTLRFDVAKNKAGGALSLGMNSRKFAEMAEARPVFVSSLSTLTNGAIIPSAGGVLVKNSEGQVIGAVGVSGDIPDVDEACAIAGIEGAGLSA
jgi:uncharacterized protein GlcG (DUF336 family)